MTFEHSEHLTLTVVSGFESLMRARIYKSMGRGRAVRLNSANRKQREPKRIGRKLNIAKYYDCIDHFSTTSNVVIAENSNHKLRPITNTSLLWHAVAISQGGHPAGHTTQGCDRSMPGVWLHG